MIEYSPQAVRLPGTSQPAIPPAVRVAVRVMYAGAAASVIHAVVVLAAAGAMKSAIAQKHPSLSAGTLSTLSTITVISTASELVLLALSGLLVAAAGALGPAGWASRVRTITALRAE